MFFLQKIWMYRDLAREFMNSTKFTHSKNWSWLFKRMYTSVPNIYLCIYLYTVRIYDVMHVYTSYIPKFNCWTSTPTKSRFIGNLSTTYCLYLYPTSFSTSQKDRKVDSNVLKVINWSFSMVFFGISIANIWGPQWGPPWNSRQVFFARCPDESGGDLGTLRGQVGRGHGMHQGDRETWTGGSYYRMVPPQL